MECVCEITGGDTDRKVACEQLPCRDQVTGEKPSGSHGKYDAI